MHFSCARLKPGSQVDNAHVLYAQTWLRLLTQVCQAAWLRRALTLFQMLYAWVGHKGPAVCWLS
jgi:hypothetical protein